MAEKDKIKAQHQLWKGGKQDDITFIIARVHSKIVIQKGLN